MGAGINYTIFYDEKRSSSITGIDYDNSFGWARQAGFDIALSDVSSINFDVNNGTITTNNTDIDPWIFSVGVGYRV